VDQPPVAQPAVEPRAARPNETQNQTQPAGRAPAAAAQQAQPAIPKIAQLATKSFRFDPNPVTLKADLSIISRGPDKGDGTLMATFRNDRTSFSTVLDLKITSGPDGLTGTWKEKSGNGKGRIVLKPGTQSMEVQILDPSGITQIQPTVLVFWFEN
jgi:hypothetical protein